AQFGGAQRVRRHEETVERDGQRGAGCHVKIFIIRNNPMKPRTQARGRLQEA
ncbi:hypothetical protein G3N57_33530, partial [Paraburkholderia sp. Se-20369]|nr:hypothetical protein [Paraburkholderia sp. Se-20369]